MKNDLASLAAIPANPEARLGLTVRLARPADLPEIAACGARFAAASGCAEFLPASPDEITAAVSRLIGLPGVKIWLGATDHVVGGLGVIFAPALWRPSSLHAEELFFWIEPGAPGTTALRLLRAANAEMRATGVVTRTFYSLPTSPPGIGRLYGCMGMRPVQLGYMGFV